MCRAGGQAHTVLVPLKHPLVGGKRGQHGIRFSGSGQLHVIPANLPQRVAPHRATQRPGQKLRAQANAEHGHVAGDGFADDLDLGVKVRIGVDLIRVHRAAEHDQRGILVELRAKLGLPAEVDVTNPETGLLE